MRRFTQRLAAASLAASALGLAAGVLDGTRRETPLMAPAVAHAPSLIDTLVLLRWGHGALDWFLPEETGDHK
ncbi:MAG: hypothetical protein ACXWAC_11150 [Usitatibacter sp.]